MVDQSTLDTLASLCIRTRRHVRTSANRLLIVSAVSLWPAPTSFAKFNRARPWMKWLNNATVIVRRSTQFAGKIFPRRLAQSFKVHCRVQELATPACGITSIKFSTRRSRRDVEIRQNCYIVVLTKGYKWKTRALQFI